MNEKIICRQKGKDMLYKIWHADSENMIIYMHSDGGSVVCSEKSYPIKKGVLCFVGADKYHYTMPDDPEIYDRSKIFFSDEKLEKILNAADSDTISGYFSSKSFIYAMVNEKDDEKIEKLFEKAKESIEKDVFDLLFISCIAELLSFIYRYSIENAPAASGVLNKAIEYINGNITKDLTIDEICARVHMSKYHFCRQFKAATGTTIMKYILKTRLVMAKNMLSDKRLSITEISSRCGFCSVAYFSRVFKQETGLSPLVFRKER